MDGFQRIWRNSLHGQSSLSHLGNKLLAECQLLPNEELAREQASMLNKQYKSQLYNIVI